MCQIPLHELATTHTHSAGYLMHKLLHLLQQGGPVGGVSVVHSGRHQLQVSGPALEISSPHSGSFRWESQTLWRAVQHKALIPESLWPNKAGLSFINAWEQTKRSLYAESRCFWRAYSHTQIWQMIGTGIVGFFEGKEEKKN